MNSGPDDSRSAHGFAADPLALSRVRGGREVLHHELRVLLTGYGDDELQPADRARVEAHLVSCERCERDLEMQLRLRGQLATLDTSAIPTRQEDRLHAMLRLPIATIVADSHGPTDAAVASVRSAARTGTLTPRFWRTTRGVVAASGWLVAASVTAVLWSRSRAESIPASSEDVSGATHDGAAMAIDPAPVPMVEAALADYRRRTGVDLPAGDLRGDSVSAPAPGQVPGLRRADVRVVAAWTTEIRGERVAAVAYRWRDRVVVLYTVSEQLFFRQARVRRAVARGAIYAVRQGPVSAVAWANSSNGSILIGNASPAELAVLRS
ncbi:MAG: hypothetical protein NVS1B4_11860 [Gemmatimonadaceae bacterium]